MADKHRFIVFGCCPADQLLVENHCNTFEFAAIIASLTSVAEFKARIWDTEQRGFLKQAVIEKAVDFYGQ